MLTQHLLKSDKITSLEATELVCIKAWVVYFKAIKVEKASFYRPMFQDIIFVSREVWRLIPGRWNMMELAGGDKTPVPLLNLHCPTFPYRRWERQAWLNSEQITRDLPHLAKSIFTSCRGSGDYFTLFMFFLYLWTGRWMKSAARF